MLINIYKDQFKTEKITKIVQIILKSMKLLYKKQKETQQCPFFIKNKRITILYHLNH